MYIFLLYMYIYMYRSIYIVVEGLRQARPRPRGPLPPLYICINIFLYMYIYICSSIYIVVEGLRQAWPRRRGPFFLLDLFRAPTIDGHWQSNRVTP